MNKSSMIRIGWFGILALLISPVGMAQMYKYQDENGRWHFTDRLPESAKDKAQALSADGRKQNKRRDESSSTESTEQAKSTGLKDIKARLLKRFEPDTPVEKASIAVVGIKSKLGGGSGFFITDTGYIVTNRHVIRPSKSTKETQKEIDKQMAEIQAWGKRLQKRKKKLDNYQQELKDFKASIDKSSGQAAAADMADYEFRYDEYKELKGRYEEQRSEYKEAESEVRKAKRELDWAVNLASVAKTFEISTKDQKKHKAKLVYISKEYDLALLKLDGVTVPVLAKGDSEALSQGERVFAIGSPLGQRDSVTSGVITRVEREVVITDTQILPGNSGGPLIDQSGKVVAVNTLKVSQKRGYEGFGYSIPIEVVMEEFRGKMSR